MKVSIIGTGYVGLVTGVAFAKIGHHVVCIGRNKEKIAKIAKGIAPFYEPGLDDMLRQVIAQKYFSATTDFSESIVASDITIIAVGTPTVDHAIDLTEIKEATKELAQTLAKKTSYHVVVVKSTVVPGTTQKVVGPMLEQYSMKSLGRHIGLCMNPEFLREGNAVEDSLHPDRIVIGSFDKKSARIYSKLFSKSNCPIFFTNLPTAEMSKYVANTLLATLVSFSNEIGRVATKIPGVDVVDVWKTVHADGRWSPKIGKKIVAAPIVQYLFTGCGYGGSCFPKDTKAFYHFAKQNNVNMQILEGTIAINETQPLELISLLTKAIGDLHGKKIAVLGLSFKPDTDDIRQSPAIPVLHRLIASGAKVHCHDPEAYHAGIPEQFKTMNITLQKDYQHAISGAEGAIIVTGWDIYRKISPKVLLQYMKQPVLIDGRRIYDPDTFRKAGVRYYAIGLAA